MIMIADQLQHVTGSGSPASTSSPRSARSRAGSATSSRPSSRSPGRCLGFLLAMALAAAAVLAAGGVVRLRRRGLPPGGVCVVGAGPGPWPPMVQLPALHPQSLRELSSARVHRADRGLQRRRGDAQFVARRGEEIVATGAARRSAWPCRAAHGFPVSSSGTRTAIAVTVGNKTKAYSLAVAGRCAGGLAVPRLPPDPDGRRSRIVIFAAIELIDVTAFRRLLAFRRTELLIAVATFLGVLAFHPVRGADRDRRVRGRPVVVACCTTRVQGLRYPALAGMHDVDEMTLMRGRFLAVADATNVPLFFANAEDFRRRACCRGPAARPPGAVRAQRRGQHRSGSSPRAPGHGRDPRGDHWLGDVFALARVKQDLLAHWQAFGLAQEIGTSCCSGRRRRPSGTWAAVKGEAWGSGNQRP